MDNVIDAIQPATTSANSRPHSPVQPATAPSPSQTTVARSTEWDQYITPAPDTPVAPHQVDTQGTPSTLRAPDAWNIQPPHVPEATSRPSLDTAWPQGVLPDPWAETLTYRPPSPGHPYGVATPPPRVRGAHHNPASTSATWPTTPSALGSPPIAPWGEIPASSPSHLTGAAYFGSAPAVAPATSYIREPHYTHPHVYGQHAPARYHQPQPTNHPLKLLSFLGACPWGSRHGHLEEAHVTFRQIAVAHEFRIRNTDPSSLEAFIPAPQSVVVMADLRQEVV